MPLRIECVGGISIFCPVILRSRLLQPKKSHALRPGRSFTPTLTFAIESDLHLRKLQALDLRERFGERLAQH